MTMFQEALIVTHILCFWHTLYVAYLYKRFVILKKMFSSKLNLLRF